MRKQKLQVRLTPNEFAAIRQNATINGYGNMSEFVRSIATQNGSQSNDKKSA